VLDSALLDDIERRRVDDDLVQTGFDEPTGEVLDLLACLDEEVPAGRDLDGDAFARVAGPDVQARVARAAVDRPERRGSQYRNEYTGRRGETNRKLRSEWNPARIVSRVPYLTKSEAVGARRCGLYFLLAIHTTPMVVRTVPISTRILESPTVQI